MATHQSGVLSCARQIEESTDLQFRMWVAVNVLVLALNVVVPPGRAEVAG
jgi:hypothetical protein